MGKKIPLTKGNAKEWDQHPLCGTKIQPGNPAAKQASDLTENSPKGSVALDTSGSVRQNPTTLPKRSKYFPSYCLPGYPERAGRKQNP